MKVRSVFLCSAAALFMGSSAQAADAILAAEPDSPEYVRVCDVYGSGFYYIPGTETCLKISGYVRQDIAAGALGQTDDTYKQRARFALRMDARSETELGTLRAYAQVNFDYRTRDDDGDVYTANEVELNHGYIELAGFLVGKTDSVFKTFTGDAGEVINDDLIPYGPSDTQQIVYNYESENGFQAVISLEEGSEEDYTLDSYVPHVVVGAAYEQDWLRISGVAGRDAVWEEWAGKVRLDVEPTDEFALFAMVGYGSRDADDDPNFYANWEGNWAAWGGASYEVSKKSTLNFQVSYDEAENFAAVANVAYMLVPGLEITPEIAYVDNFDNDEDNGDTIGGQLRIERKF